jgi:hypothetical protein
MDTQRLKNAVRYFEDEPLRLDMDDWVRVSNNPDMHDPPCGTVACMAGSAIVLQAKERGVEIMSLYQDIKYGQPVHDDLHSRQSLHDFGKEFYDLTEEQAKVLFYTGRWPQPYQRLYLQLSRDFSRCNHPHVLKHIKKAMVYVLEERVHLLINTGE